MTVVRYREENGKISRKHGNTLIQTLRNTYGINFSRRSAAFGPFLAAARNSEVDIRMSLAMRSISASSQQPKSDSEAPLSHVRHHASKV
jgi:hypothetical protein